MGNGMSWFDKSVELDILDEMAANGELTPKQYVFACRQVRRYDRTAKYAAELAKASVF